MIPNIIQREVHLEAQETQAFSIEANAKAFKILIDGLYKDKIRSVTREIWTNAYDSHVAAGKKDVPFDVSFPSLFDPTFKVKDYGVGLSHDEIINIYTRLFKSTKEDTNEQAGRLGIGSKTPFAYTDSFSIISIKNGIKNYYTAMIGKEGYPAIHKLHSENTDEGNGLEVSFPVKKHDVHLFQEAANYVSLGFDLKPNIVGGSHIWPEKFTDYIDGPIARMGCVIYPIDMAIVLKNASVMGQYEQDLVKFFYNMKMIYEFDMGELEFTASREDLSYGDGEPTIRSIIKKLEEKMVYYSDKIVSLYEQIDCPDMKKYWHNVFRNRSSYNSYNYNNDLDKCVNIIENYFLNEKNIPDVLKDKKTLIAAHSIIKQNQNHVNNIKLKDYLIEHEDFVKDKINLNFFTSSLFLGNIEKQIEIKTEKGDVIIETVNALKAFELETYSYYRKKNKLFVTYDKSGFLSIEYSRVNRYVYILEDINAPTKKLRNKLLQVFGDTHNDPVYGLIQTKPKDSWFFEVKSLTTHYKLVYGERKYLDKFKEMMSVYKYNIHIMEASSILEKVYTVSENNSEEIREKRDLLKRMSEYYVTKGSGGSYKPVTFESNKQIDKVYVIETTANKYKEEISQIDLLSLSEVLKENEYFYVVGVSKMPDFKKYYGDKLIVLTLKELYDIVKSRIEKHISKKSYMDIIVDNYVCSHAKDIFNKIVMRQENACNILSRVENPSSLATFKRQNKIFENVKFEDYQFTKRLNILLDGIKDSSRKTTIEKIVTIQHIIFKFKDELPLYVEVQNKTKDKIEDYKIKANDFYKTYEEIIILHNLLNASVYEYSDDVINIWKYIVFHKEKI